MARVVDDVEGLVLTQLLQRVARQMPSEHEAPVEQAHGPGVVLLQASHVGGHDLHTLHHMVFHLGWRGMRGPLQHPLDGELLLGRVELDAEIDGVGHPEEDLEPGPFDGRRLQIGIDDQRLHTDHGDARVPEDETVELPLPVVGVDERPPPVGIDLALDRRPSTFDAATGPRSTPDVHMLPEVGVLPGQRRQSLHVDVQHDPERRYHDGAGRDPLGIRPQLPNGAIHLSLHPNGALPEDLANRSGEEHARDDLAQLADLCKRRRALRPDVLLVELLQDREDAAVEGHEVRGPHPPDGALHHLHRESIAVEVAHPDDDVRVGSAHVVGHAASKRLGEVRGGYPPPT